MTMRDVFKDVLFLSMTIIAGVLTLKDGFRWEGSGPGPKVDWDNVREITPQEFEQRHNPLRDKEPNLIKVEQANPLRVFERLPPV